MEVAHDNKQPTRLVSQAPLSNLPSNLFVINVPMIFLKS